MRWFLVSIIALASPSLSIFNWQRHLCRRSRPPRAPATERRAWNRTASKHFDRSLINQNVGTYQRIGATRGISPMEETLINAYGASIADAMVTKMLTVDSSRNAKPANSKKRRLLVLCRIAALGDLPRENWLSLLDAST